MRTRVGIELTGAACRIVEVESGPARRRDTRVRWCAVLPPSGPQTTAALRSFRRHRAAVVVWGPASEHRQVLVRPGSYEEMRAEAIAALSAAGVPTLDMLVDIAPAGPPRDGKRRPVVVALASAAAIKSAMQPVIDAGIRVRTVMTPAIALNALMRARRDRSGPEDIEAFIALDETSTAIALIRDGALIVSRMLLWGYVESPGGRQPRRREDIAARLADELAGFFHAAGGSTTSVRHICIASGLPELRSMTVPLMERLDLEVEPLDSLFAIDAKHAAGDGINLRDRVAELRIAWASAADWPAPLNLMRARNRQRSRVVLSRAAVVAGMAVGWGAGWRVSASSWWQSTASRPVAHAAAPAARPTTPVPPPAPLRIATATPPMPSSPVSIVSREPDSPPPPAAPAPRVRELPTASAPIVRAELAVPVPQPTLLTSVAPPARAARAITAAPRAVRARSASQADVQEPAGRFDAVLGTILYSAERRLAIVDGHIVGLGDEVRGARVVDIDANSVLLRDGSGRSRRLTLGANVR
ncbi:MAG: hypothetical protein HY048_00875 [Acidobacteria bacterium]|nr:hypothetical protein [Acidobacteriota bacterium]